MKVHPVKIYSPLRVIAMANRTPPPLLQGLPAVVGCDLGNHICFQNRLNGPQMPHIRPTIKIGTINLILLFPPHGHTQKAIEPNGKTVRLQC